MWCGTAGVALGTAAGQAAAVSAMQRITLAYTPAGSRGPHTAILKNQLSLFLGRSHSGTGWSCRPFESGPLAGRGLFANVRRARDCRVVCCWGMRYLACIKSLRSTLCADC